MNDWLDEIQSYDNALQAMMDLAEKGDNTLWDRGDVMLKMLPPEDKKHGRPPKDKVKVKTFNALGIAGRLGRQYANRVYLTSHYYLRESENRFSLLEAGVYWTFADMARHKCPNIKTSVKECLHAMDQTMTRRTFKNYLEEKYPGSSNDIKAVDGFEGFIIHGDMMDVLQEWPVPGSVRCVIADPPYNVTGYDWDQFESPKEFIDQTAKWIDSIYHVLNEQYHLFWFCSPKFAADIEMLFRDREMPIKSRIVWHRRNMTLGSDARERFLDTWEMVFHVGTRPMNWNDDEWTEERFDVQTHAVPQTNFKDKKLHPTQKPLALIRRLVVFGSEVGDVILDPFAGSGTTGHACALEERNCILIERDKKYIKIIERRLNAKRSKTV